MTDSLKHLCFDGQDYTFDPALPSMIKRGIIDPYDASAKNNEWVILEPYIYWSAVLQQVLVIPRWFRTDLASIPAAFRWLISVNERHRLASLPHDLIYTMHCCGERTPSRYEADAVLLEFCQLMGVTRWKSLAIFHAVRVGGWVTWRKRKRSQFISNAHRGFYIAAFSNKIELPREDGLFLPLTDG